MLQFHMDSEPVSGETFPASVYSVRLEMQDVGGAKPLKGWVEYLGTGRRVTAVRSHTFRAE